MALAQDSKADSLLTEAGREVLCFGKGLSLEPMRGRRVLVTGATGMIGRVTCAALKAFGGIKVIEADSKWGLMEALKANAAFIIHGAGYAQPSKFMGAPLDTIDLNTNWTMKLARQLPKDGRMVFLSSSEVCSGSPHQRHGEDDIGTTTPAHARAAYIEGKRCGEAIVHALRAEGRNVTAARVSLAYGPGVKKGDTRAVNQFITQALKNGEIKLQDGGQARRNYCYVTDTVELILNVLMRGREAVYNVGGESETTVLALARKIAAQMGVQASAPRGLGNAMREAPAHVSLNMTRAKVEFGKYEFVPLDEGLSRTIAWHRAIEGIEEAARA